MATLTGIATKYKGTAGEWTFYNRLGTTVAKQKVDSIGSRHASEAQLANRVAWANLVSFWSSMNGLLAGAFPRKGRNRTDYNAFMSHNLGECKVYLTREQVIRGACVAAPYQLSFGVLPTIGTSVTADGRLRTDIAVGDDFAIGPATTIGDLSRAVLTRNARFRHGDLIVVVAVEQRFDTTGGTPHVKVSSALLQLDACNATPLSATGDGPAAFAAVGGFLGATAPIFGGMAWMHIQSTGRTVNISPQRLVVTGLPSDPYRLPHTPYTTPEARQAAMDSYKHD